MQGPRRLLQSYRNIDSYNVCSSLSDLCVFACSMHGDPKDIPTGRWTHRRRCYSSSPKLDLFCCFRVSHERESRAGSVKRESPIWIWRTAKDGTQNTPFIRHRTKPTHDRRQTSVNTTEGSKTHAPGTGPRSVQLTHAYRKANLSGIFITKERATFSSSSSAAKRSSARRCYCCTHIIAPTIKKKTIRNEGSDCSQK